MPRCAMISAGVRPFFNHETGVRTSNRNGVEVNSTFITTINLAGRITAQSRAPNAPMVTVQGAVYGTVTAQSRMKGTLTISVPLHGRIKATSRASTFIPVPVSLAGRIFSKSNMRIVPPGIKTLTGRITAMSAAKSGFTSPPAARTKDFSVTVITG
jgi:hypothetical protein